MKDEAYWERVRAKAKELNSDGCTGVIDCYVDCCSEHDIAYETGCNVDGIPQTRAFTDAEFRKCIQSQSRFKMCSPMSYVRWLGVRLFGRGFWSRKDT
jgi:hypothetical protein